MLPRTSLVASLQAALNTSAVQLHAVSGGIQSLALPAAQVTGSVRHLATPASSEAADSPSSSGSSSQSSDNRVEWDWQWVLGKGPGRKPAIKRPATHQWFYCNPNYDPSKPLPTAYRSPYAPPTAVGVKYSTEFKQFLDKRPPDGTKDLKTLRLEFRRFQALREVDWREAFQQGVAEDTRAFRNQQRQAAEVKRQDAWRAYKAALFERARLEAGEQGPAAASGSAVAAAEAK